MHTDSTGRGAKPGQKDPWCWSQKAALRRIRDWFNAETGVATALVVYTALTEISSDRGGADRFIAHQAEIAATAGVSISAVKRALEELKQIGVITVTTPKLRGPCTFQLLRVAADIPAIAPCGPALAQCEPTLAQSSKMAPELLGKESLKKEGNKKSKKGIRFELEAGRMEEAEQRVREGLQKLGYFGTRLEKEVGVWADRFLENEYDTMGALTDTKSDMVAGKIIENPAAYATELWKESRRLRVARETGSAPSAPIESPTPSEAEPTPVPLESTGSALEKLNAELTKVRSEIEALKAVHLNGKAGSATLQLNPEAKEQIQGLLKRAREIRELIAGLEKEPA